MTAPIPYTGGTVTSGTTFNGTIDGIEYCLTFEEEVDGSSTHILTSVNSIDADCLECTTPDPTPIPEIISVYERCGGIGCFETDISFGEQTDPNAIISNWVRFSSFAGVNYPGTTIKSGLQTNGSIITNDPSKYFYTGTTNLDYLGVLSSVMTEGENVGPSGLQQNNNDSGKFYYNNFINKFVVWFNVKGQSNGWQWSTWDPTENTGLQYGNPTATRFLTTSTNWSTAPLTISNLTVSGASNTVVTAINKITDAGGVTDMIRCSQNSGLFNGFYSTCGYEEYTHEVTMGSTATDNDTIGLVLAAFKDNDGIYGPSGQTQTLQLTINGDNNNSRIIFNQNNNTQSFTDGAGNFNTLVWQGTSPYGSGNYNGKGQIRFKVVKTGTTISVYNTSKMGTGNGQLPIGSTNPYTLLVSIDLTDDATWTNKPSYAVGTELLRFTGGTQFGYLTASQRQTQFYDIVFSGSQQTNTDTLYGLNVVNPGLNNISTFNEVPGCWDYIEDVTGYTGPSYTITLDTGYPSCTQCPSDNSPLPSLTPTSTPTPTPTPTPTGSPVVPPTPTPTPTPTGTQAPSGPNAGWVSGGVIPCNTFCTQVWNISQSTTWDGSITAPTFIYGLQDFGGNQNNPAWFAFRSDVGTGQTGPGNANSYQVAEIIKETTGPNAGVYGRVTSLYAGACYTISGLCIPE